MIKVKARIKNSKSDIEKLYDACSLVKQLKNNAIINVTNAECEVELEVNQIGLDILLETANEDFKIVSINADEDLKFKV